MVALVIHTIKNSRKRILNIQVEIEILEFRIHKLEIAIPDEDYIHASYVTVSNDLTYICAQGPLLNTVQDFWIMAIQEETNVFLSYLNDITHRFNYSFNYNFIFCRIRI